MRQVSLAEEWRNKMTYETAEQCDTCGNHLIAWRQEGRGKPFCEHCRAEEMKEQQEKQQLKWTKDAYQAKAVHKLKGSSLLKDKEVWSYSLNDYKVVDAETQKALKIARQAVLSIHEGETLHVVFSGVAGAGKTTLSMGIVKEVLELDVNAHCMIIDYQYLLEERMASFNDKYLSKTMDKIMNDAYRADVLVIDDLGAETSRSENKKQTASDFTVKTLNSILQARVNKTTIVTTNLTGIQIKQAYGERITSRLFAHSKEYAMSFTETPDKRLHPVTK